MHGASACGTILVKTVQPSDNAMSQIPHHAYLYSSQLNQSLFHCRLWLRNRVLGSGRESLLLIPAVLRLLLLLRRLLPRRRGLHWHLDVLGSRVLPIRGLRLLLVLLSWRRLLLRRLLMRWLRMGSWRWRLRSILGLLGILLQRLLEIRVWGWRRFRRSTGRRKRVLAWLLEIKGCIRITRRSCADRLGSIGLLLRERKVAHLRGSSFTWRIVRLCRVLIWRCRRPPAVLSWWLLLLLLRLRVLVLRWTG